MKRLLSLILYLFVAVSTIAGLSQVFERHVTATAGVCCAASSDRAPGGCNGPNYCEDKRAD
jgi:hypothetical protein